MLKEVFSPDFLPASVMIPLFLIIGIAGLYYGAELLVKGASELALHFKVKPVIIGLTVVAFGTSAPELMVSLIAAFQGEADVSVGNIVGSNIANIGLIIGLTAMLIPITRTSEPSRFEFWCLAGISLLLIGLSVGGMLGRLEGAVLFSLLIVFLAWCYKNGSMDPSDEVPDEVSRPLWASTVLLVLGLLILPVGGQFMVTGATSFARLIGISELVIGHLEFTRRPEPVIVEVKINDLLEGLVELNQRVFSFKKISIIRDYQEDLPPVQSDGRQLGLVFQNLINNSKAAIGSDGEIWRGRCFYGPLPLMPGETILQVTGL